MSEINWLNTCVVIKGITKQGPRKGQPYAMYTVDRAHQFNQFTIDAAVKAGVRVIDMTPK